MSAVVHMPPLAPFTVFLEAALSISLTLKQSV